MILQKLVHTVAVAVPLIGLVGGVSNHLTAGPPAADKNVLPPVIRSAQSGAWSAPATWQGNQVPGAGARVLVRRGHRIVYDAQSDQAIRAINLAGALTFAPDKDTRLDVGLIRIQAGEEYSEEGFDCTGSVAQPHAALEVGTPTRPIDGLHTAIIRLVYQQGMNKESCPAIICCGGRMDLHGAPMNRTWGKLGATVQANDRAISLAEPVTGWRVGDRIIVTATSQIPDQPGGTEARTIQAIDGARVTLKEPLAREHLGSGDYRGEVANLSRNVVVESADPRGIRGHTVYHRSSAGAISYVEFRHLGKQGVRGRHALNYHLAGDTMRGSYVLGASIWDSANGWLAIHGTNYLVVRDCVGYHSASPGYCVGYQTDPGCIMETGGTEVLNVLDRNLAVRASGAGFGWANSLNTFTRNVATECNATGFRNDARLPGGRKHVMPIQQPDGSLKAVDIRTLPFVRFDGNEVHSNVGYANFHVGFTLGAEVQGVGPDSRHPIVVRNMRIWDTYCGFHPVVQSLLVENMQLHRTHYGIFLADFNKHVYRNLTINGDGGETFSGGRDGLLVQNGPLAVDGLTFENVRPGGTALIPISPYSLTGKGVSHFRNVKVLPQDAANRRTLVNASGSVPNAKIAHGVTVYLHDYFGPNRNAKVVAANSKDFGADGLAYREVPPLTGHDSRVCEVKDVEFPKLLDPIDDLPPATVITHVRRIDVGKLQVRGTTSDNGTVTKVWVNGKETRALSSNFAEWEIVLEGVPAAHGNLEAYAEDDAGNVEKRPHVRMYDVSQ